MLAYHRPTPALGRENPQELDPSPEEPIVFLSVVHTA